MSEILIFAFVLAFLVGMLSAILGIGGGAINVPILMFLFSLDYKVAVGTSLVIIVCSTLTSALTYIKQNQVVFRVALYLAIPALIASAICSHLTQLISTLYLSLFFACFIFLIGVQMMSSPIGFIFPINYGPIFEEEKKTSFGTAIRAKFSYLHLLIWGLISGCANGLTGIGGGIINVPAMVLGGLPMHFAVATSSLVMFSASAAGAFVYHSHGNIAPIPILVTYIVGGMIGSFTGARTSHKVPEKELRFAFGLLLIVVALSIVLQRVL
jgi:uncharacterized membrane protein YfcA